nr:hypothetical protein [Flavobacterium sp.]
MKKIFFLILVIFSIKAYSQENALKNFHQTLKYSKVYKVDLDTNTWYFQHFYNTNIMIDIGTEGSGRILVYYNNNKNVYYTNNNNKVRYSDGSSTYFFVLENDRIIRLGINSLNQISAFSIVLADNTTITFSN